MSLTLLSQGNRIASMMPIKLTKNNEDYSVCYKLIIPVFLIFSTLFFMTGCGGGGGSDDSISVSPAEEEVKVVLSRLATAINATDTASVMSVFNTNLKYFKSPFTPIGYLDVQKEMNNFFGKATQINMKFENIAMRSGSEDSASVLALLICTFTDQNQANQTFSEEVELFLLKDGVWGITDFYKYDKSDGQTGSNFPPSL